jgi:hypothetical protein
MGRRVTHVGAMRNEQQFVRKHEAKRPLGKRRRRCEDNIKMYLRVWGVRVLTELMWLRIETRGNLL